jgi:hypothetical protein
MFVALLLLRHDGDGYDNDDDGDEEDTIEMNANEYQKAYYGEC